MRVRAVVLSYNPRVVNRRSPAAAAATSPAAGAATLTWGDFAQRKKQPLALFERAVQRRQQFRELVRDPQEHEETSISS